MRTGFKKVWSIIVLAFIALVLVGCSDNQAKAKANKLYIPKHDAIAGSFALPKYVEGDTKAPVTWESSHPNIVSIGEIPDWEVPTEEDTMQPTPDLYYKATVVLPAEETVVTLKATVTYEGKKAVRNMEITVVADTYEAMTVEEAKAANLNTKVKLTGTVVYTSTKGYAIKDDTGYMYVYLAEHGREIGDIVNVRGLTAVYNNMPQLSSSTAEQIGVEDEDFDPYADIEEITIDELNNHQSTDKGFYTTMYKIKGKILTSTDSSNPYRITDPIDSSKFVAVTKYSSTASLNDLKDNFVNKYVEMVIVIYSYAKNAYNVCYVEDTAEETEITYTEKQKADITLQKMVDLVKDEILTWDITLPTEDDEFDATVEWESSNTAILTNDGKFTAPNAETEIELTVTVTVGNTTVDETVKVKAVKLEVSKVNTLFDRTPLNSSDATPLVLVQGKVIGHQYRGYWVADETGAVLISSSVRPGLNEIVQVKGNLTAYKPNESFNMQIEQLGYRELEDAEEPTLISPVTMSIADIFALGVNSQATAKEVAKTYYGKLITITGKVRGSGNYWYIDGATTGQFFRLNNLESNAGLTQGDDVTITVMVRDIYYIDDASGYNNFKVGTFGGVFFSQTDIVK